MSEQRRLPFATIQMLEGMAWRLRDAWLTRRTVRVDLAERCSLPFIVGRVSGVSVTGASVTIDGWQVPVDEVTKVGTATDADRAEYAHAMHTMREGAGNARP